MLVLGRKLDESIVFPDLDIEVVVTQIRRGCVRLGVIAPTDVRVLRNELVEDEEGDDDAA